MKGFLQIVSIKQALVDLADLVQATDAKMRGFRFIDSKQNEGEIHTVFNDDTEGNECLDGMRQPLPVIKEDVRVDYIAECWGRAEFCILLAGIDINAMGEFIDAAFAQNLVLRQVVSWRTDSTTATLYCAALPRMSVSWLRDFAKAFEIEYLDEKSSVKVHDKDMTPQTAIEYKNNLQAVMRKYTDQIADEATSRKPDNPDEIIAASKTYGIMKHLIEATASNLDLMQLVIWHTSIFNAAMRNHTAFCGMEITPEFIQKVPPSLWLFRVDSEALALGFRGDLNLDSLPGFETGECSVEAFILTPITVKNKVNPQAFFGGSGQEKLVNETQILWGVILNSLDRKRIVPVFRWFRGLEPGAIVDNETSALIALLEFMNLKIISKDATPPGRTFKRQAERRKEKVNPVYTIRLRRTESNGKGTGEPRGKMLEGTHVTWHWRLQHYKGGIAKRIYIGPYWRGPIPEGGIPAMPNDKQVKHVYKVVR